MAIIMDKKDATISAGVEVGIRDLRDGLSRHLASVVEGNRIVVTDHGKPIAQIVPLGHSPRLEQLMKEGRVTAAKAPKRDPGEPIDLGVSVLDLLDQQRA